MSKSGYEPPYHITDKMVNLISRITEIVTTIEIKQQINSNPKLRRDNRIKTIHASLAIENNTLTLDQVTDIIDGKRVLGPQNEIYEVKNAFEVYEKLLQMKAYSIHDMLMAHKILMKDLTKEVGIFRNGGVGIFAGEKLVHMAPSAELVPSLVKELFAWLKTSKDVHPLIKSSVFHYEFEFIHPFADGNGRMGRMWQTLLLYNWNSVFGWLPVETLIKERQEEYYRVLGECDYEANSTKFVEFILRALYDTLIEVSKTDQVTDQETDQVKKLMHVIGDEVLSAAELMNRLGIKHKPTFRDNYLKPAIEKGIIEMTLKDKPNSSKQKYRKVR
jgi:Fic family protein